MSAGVEMSWPPPGKVGSRQHREDFLQHRFRLPDQQARGFRDFAQVVRRDLGGHADGDARGTVQQHHRQARRHQLRLGHRAVVVGDEVHRAAIDLPQQQVGEGRQAAFGVAHRRGAVAVARAEVALAIDQRIAQGEILRHAHHGVIDAGVAVRVVFADHVADHPRALDVLGAGGQPHFVHCMQDAPLHRLHAVFHLRQRARAHHAHGIGEVGALGVGVEGQCGTVVFSGGRNGGWRRRWSIEQVGIVGIHWFGRLSRYRRSGRSGASVGSHFHGEKVGKPAARVEPEQHILRQ